MKQKGFTLVELLVVIVILGVITAISIPLIRNVQEGNEKKQYTTYMDSLKYSAKLYVNSYEEDLFGHSKSGCAIIRYSQMEEKGLLKDITVPDISCNSENTFVKVVKMEDQYSYVPSIGCGSKAEDGTVSVVTKMPDEGVVGVDTCGQDVKQIISFSSTPATPDLSINFQKRNITINMTSNTGFHEDIQVYYNFVTSANYPTGDYDNTHVPTVIDGWKKLTFDYLGGNEQKRRIENGEAITLSSEKIVTPTNITDDVYVVLRIDTLKDITGREWNNDVLASKYIYIGSFRADNSKPIFSASSTIVSSNASYNHVQPKLNISVSDEKFSSTENLKMCISYDSDICSKKVSDIKASNKGYEQYNGTKTLDEIQDNYDGSTHTVYVTVADAAGNYETKSYSYQLARRWTLTYNSNGGSTCDPTTKSITFNEDTPTAWGTLCEPSRTGYEFVGWNTSTDGSGDTITASTNAVGNVTVYAQWNAITYNITYAMNSGTNSSSNPATYTIETPTITLQAPTRAGYSFDGWTGSNGTTAQTSITIPQGSTGDKTYTANWKLSVVTVTINGALGETITCKYCTNDSCSTNETCKDTSGNSITIKLDNVGTVSTQLKPGKYQFTSNVAKATDNENNKYSKIVTVSESSSTINFYPDGAIYWYGNGAVRNSSLFSRCGGISYTYTYSNDGRTTNTKSGDMDAINTDDRIQIRQNYLMVYVPSGGGAYYSNAKCKNSTSKGNYKTAKAFVKGGKYEAEYRDSSGNERYSYSKIIFTGKPPIQKGDFPAENVKKILQQTISTNRINFSITYNTNIDRSGATIYAFWME